jgi:mannose-6-phosphate isomerase-like protein (cupin superfamily)
MERDQLERLLAQQAASGRPYLEFIRTDALSVGVYVLSAGATDIQQPHTEDEVYHVITGRARMTVAGETFDVESGAVIFVAAHVAHRFHDITEELRILVFFAPPEGSLATR